MYDGWFKCKLSGCYLKQLVRNSRLKQLINTRASTISPINPLNRIIVKYSGTDPATSTVARVSPRILTVIAFGLRPPSTFYFDINLIRLGVHM